MLATPPTRPARRPPLLAARDGRPGIIERRLAGCHSQRAHRRLARANAGTYKRVSEEPPQDRITLLAWFERKHRKVELAV